MHKITIGEADPIQIFIEFLSLVMLVRPVNSKLFFLWRSSEDLLVMVQCNSIHIEKSQLNHNSIHMDTFKLFSS